MNFKTFFNLQLESNLLVREFHDFPKLLNIKWNRFSKKLQNILDIKNKLVAEDLYYDLEYYLRGTVEENIVEGIKKILDPDPESSTRYNSIIKHIGHTKQVFDSSLDPKNGWRYSDLIKHSSHYTNNIIKDVKDEFFRVLYDERFQERLEESIETWNKNLQDTDYGWGSLEKQYIQELLNCKQHIDVFLKEMEEINIKVVNMAKMYANRVSDNKLIEPLEEVETAYHASTNAREIFNKGFNPTYKSTGSNEGIGGGNIENGISFTLDLYHAKNIARTLKIAWMIAHKKYNIRDIVEMIKHFPYQNSDLKSLIDAFTRRTDKNVFPPKDEYQLFDFYVESLWKTKTYNPVFFGIDTKKFIDNLKTKNYKDIGVVQCKVKTQEGELEYMRSMEEIRVNPSSVISVDKLIQ